MSLLDNVRDVLAKSEGMSVDELCVALGMENDRGTVMKCCTNAKYQGRLIGAMENGHVVYRLAPDGVVPKQKANPTQNAEGAKVAPPGASSKKPKLERVRKAARKTTEQRKRDFFAAAETAEKTLKALQFNVTTAADAIEVYVHSVVDPVTYTALKNAHVSALAALEAFSAQGAEA